MLRNASLAAVLAAAAGSALAIGAAGPAGAVTAVVWSATATKATPSMNGATKLGPLAGSTPISITVGLELRNQSELDSFIANESSPASTDFGQTYTPASFTAAFGPTSASVNAVESYLKSDGFTNVETTSNNLLVTATGTAAGAEQAFHTSLSEFSLDGKDVYANTSAAMVPSRLAGTVAGVLGLNDAFKAGPTPVTAGTQSSTVPNVVNEFTPQGFWKAYQATGTSTGHKTSIATIASAALTVPISNLRAEEKANGLKKVPVTVEYAGIKNSATTPTDNVEWDLDSQFSTGMAAAVQHFYYYDATSLSTVTLALTYNLWATQDEAQAASASLGECEYQPYLDGAMMIDDEIFAEAAAQGQTMFASAGDSGSFCSVGIPNGVPAGMPMVNYPASSPFVVGVGGTTLVTNSTGSYDFELSWYAGGGGQSLFEHKPSWQQEVLPITTTYTRGRGVPDVAMDANPTTGAEVYTGSTTSLYSSTGWEGVGGTSLSAPLALGVWARIESKYNDKVGFAAPVLYGVYLKGTCTTTPAEVVCSTSALHAPEAGDNGLYPETPGYNYDTGLGTFDTAAMIRAVKPFA